MKKIFCMILSLVIACSAVFCLVACDGESEEKKIQALNYTIKGDATFEVSDVGSFTDAELVIPDTHDGRAVTSIGNLAFCIRPELTSVTIPASISFIGNSAFYWCTGLMEVNILCSEESAGVTSIGEQAFENCYNLAKINYQGTKAAWEAIAKGTDWAKLTSGITVQCTDGSLEIPPYSAE